MSKAKTTLPARRQEQSKVSVNANGYTLRGELAQQIQAQAMHLGKTPDEIVEQALLEFIAKHGEKEMFSVELAPEFVRWFERRARKGGKTPSQLLEALLIQEQNFARDTKGFPAEAAAEPTGLIRRN